MFEQKTGSFPADQSLSGLAHRKGQTGLPGLHRMYEMAELSLRCIFFINYDNLVVGRLSPVSRSGVMS